MGLREQILGAKRTKVQRVPVPEDWQPVIETDALFVREMSAKERDDYEGGRTEVSRRGRQTEAKINFQNQRAKLVVKCLCDETGKRVLADADADNLGEVPGLAPLIDLLFEAAMKLNGMALGEDEEKNSLPSGALPSASLASSGSGM